MMNLLYLSILLGQRRVNDEENYGDVSPVWNCKCTIAASLGRCLGGGACCDVVFFLLFQT